MADEHKEPRREREPSTEGASAGSDPDYHLHSELGQEGKRLAAHPREEAKRLADELREGEVETTPLLAMGWIGIVVGLLVTFVIVLVFVAACLAD